MGGFHIKKIFIILLAGLLIILSTNQLTALTTCSVFQTKIPTNTLYVGGTGAGNYTYIQDAIDNATTNDTIYVYSGTYVENLFIKTTITLKGENKTTTIIDGGNQHDVIHIQAPANHVTLTGFTIQNSGTVTGAGFDAGIEIHSHHNHIQNNIITKHYNTALFLFVSNNNTISHNLIIDINRTGIDILSGNNNTITHNNFTNNGERAIYLGFSGLSNQNLITHNNFYQNFKGLELFQSHNTITYNNFINNSWSAMAHFNFIRLTRAHNTWNENYWDTWRGTGPQYIPGLLAIINLNFDWNPSPRPIDIGGI